MKNPNPVRRSTSRLVLLCVLVLYCPARPLAATPLAIAFRYDRSSATIGFALNGRAVTIKSDDFESVFDWSTDYTRTDHGIGHLLNDGRYIFAGYLDHSRLYLFEYDTKSGTLRSFANVTLIALDDRFGWAAVKSAPLYSAAVKEHTAMLVINGGLAGEVDDRLVQSIAWDATAPTVNVKLTALPLPVKAVPPDHDPAAG